MCHPKVTFAIGINFHLGKLWRSFCGKARRPEASRHLCSRSGAPAGRSSKLLYACVRVDISGTVSVNEKGFELRSCGSPHSIAHPPCEATSHLIVWPLTEPHQLQLCMVQPAAKPSPQTFYHKAQSAKRSAASLDCQSCDITFHAAHYCAVARYMQACRDMQAPLR